MQYPIALPKIQKRIKREAGFTLVEMIVAVGLFAVVMLVCISALLSLVDANRKAQALQSVMNNLNIAVDGMVRAIRQGSNYRCGTSNPTNPDCAEDGGKVFYFKPNCAGSCLDWVYVFNDNGSYGSNCPAKTLCRSTDGGANYYALTAPEVTIDSDTSIFYVIGACPGHNYTGQVCLADQLQPKVVIVIKGEAGVAKATVHSTFHIQATAVQRILDI